MSYTARCCQIRVTGTVQGVGFRPFVFRLATSLGLAGSVRNTAQGVVIEVTGPSSAVDEFLRRLPAEAPPLARLSSLTATELPPAQMQGFRIIDSAPGRRPTALIPPDVALCEDCAREIADPRDRRLAYPFTTCTNCGPRFTIVRGLPYDRPQTTMSVFTMCSQCQAEYSHPPDRRFHAEPIACPACGPSLFLDGQPAPDGIHQAARWLTQGRIVAIKGLGGYHLACDARNADAVETLRARKGRGQKPFAIMVRDLDEARRVAEVSPRAAELLASPESPIVILPAPPSAGTGSQPAHAPLAPGLAPRQATLGLMLPYTPLHRLLLAQAPPALVMTSGNLAEEPLEHRDPEAKRKLSPIADHILSHNREIAVPCDDSVIRVQGDLVIPVRRARGYVPRSVAVDVDTRPVLGVGAHHKNTFCLLRGGEAVLSQHIGDLDSAEVLDYLGQAVRHFELLFEVKPEIVAHDLHPGYLSTRYAQSLQGVQLIPVQHHHAHLAAVMAELGLGGPAIGVSYDGAGLGADGTVWGGEIMIADLRTFTRAIQLRPTPMPGGEAAVTRPSRMALSHLLAALGPDALCVAPRLLSSLADSQARLIARQIERRLNSPLTSSMGRLFDAVAALLGASDPATYEGQPAMELEAMASQFAGPASPYPYLLADAIIDPRPILQAIVADLERGMDRAAIAARFHETVVAFTVNACQGLRAQGAPRDVVLSGGVMQNARLLAALLPALEEAGLRPHIAREVPPNDGGLSLGQAVIAAARSRI